MEYKVLIKLYVPEIEQNFEMYIPINRTIVQVLVLINKVVSDASTNLYPIKTSLTLINRRTGTIYKNEEIVRNTDIKNGSELIII